MKLILSPKDNLGKMTLDEVSGFALEGETLLVVFENGRTRNYPLQHLWYYESHVDFHKTQPLVQETARDTKPAFLTEAIGPEEKGCLKHGCNCEEVRFASQSRCT